MINKISYYTWFLCVLFLGTKIQILKDGIDKIFYYSIYNVEIDVVIQILLSVIGGVLGGILIKKTKVKRNMLFFWAGYVFFVGVSCFFSENIGISIGYLLLLIGVSLLVIGIVLNAKSVDEIEILEKYWVWAVLCILLKDTIVSMVIYEGDGDVFRLGMGTSSANYLSMLAVLLIFMVRDYESKMKIVNCIIVIISMFVIFMARSRSGIICLLVGEVIYAFEKSNQENRFFLKNIYIYGFIFLLMLFIFFDVEGFKVGSNAIAFFNRGQDYEKIISITGRTDIWYSAIHCIFDNIKNFLFGYGYGMTQYVINENYFSPDFYAYHAHNSILESMISIGFLGTLSLFVFVFISCNNIYGIVSKKKSMFYVHAKVIVSVILINSLTESFVGLKINPICILFFMYLFSSYRLKEKLYVKI